jgi:hypothetical protein
MVNDSHVSAGAEIKVAIIGHADFIRSGLIIFPENGAFIH